MSKIIKSKGYLMIKADYNTPEIHKHLASHIIISLGGIMEWKIENEDIRCRGICINSDIYHSGIMQKEGAIVFLFMEISDYALCLNEKYLKGKSYSVLDDCIIDKIIEEYKSNKSIEDIDKSILNICGINKSTRHNYDQRIEEILKYLNQIETIDNTIIDCLCSKVFLSKSRLSHLFKEETKMTLHSYLAFEKLKKTYDYIENGMNITNACILAGFNSSSHFSATCKRMFGISLTEVNKNKNSN